MTYISPILSNSLNKKNNTNKASENHYNKIYEELTRHANDVKPNAPKARLIKGGVSHAVTNTIKDGQNFFKAVKDGKLSDNNLGRINDLGMKFGALLIASFLASRAKTKTDAIMQFVGGTTFFASMSLWPKLFINLPAKIVHGFDIGQRYVSAQGDEKDFFLDNQFLPWDAYSKDELRRIGKRTGIDYDSPNGEEKIQRKMQKTALQNRTLWMATAGFATPLLTAMTGNILEPKVKDTVIERGYKKAKDILTSNLFYLQSGKSTDKTGLEEYLSSSKADLRNVTGINNLIEEYSAKKLDNDFYQRLADMLQVNAPTDAVRANNGEIENRALQMFKDLDDYAPIESFRADNLADVLRNIQEQTAVVDEKSLASVLESVSLLPDPSDFMDAGKVTSSVQKSSDNIEKILKDFEQSSDKTIGGLKKILKNNGLADSKIASVEKGLSMNNAPFFETIKEYNESVLPEIRGRFKSYMNLFNSVMGSKAESKTTKEYLAELDKLMKRFNFSYDDLKEMTKSGVESSEAKLRLAEYFKKFASKTKDLSPDEYKEMLGSFLSAPIDKELLETMEHLVDPENIKSITKNVKSTGDNEFFKMLNSAFIGSSDETKSGLIGALNRFKENKIISLEAIKAKALICSNFERRVANGEFEAALKEAGLISEQIAKDGRLKKLLGAARLLVYDGSSSVYANKAGLGNEVDFNKLVEFIYNSESFNFETSDFNIKEVVEKLGKIDPSKEKDYLRSLSFSQAITERAREVYNNKSWKRIFVPMTAALIGVTLLVQPFFGKIKNEFPEEGKNGGAR